MSIVKVGPNEYEIHCSLCGGESADTFSSRSEARQYVENNEDGWVDDFENGFICSSCRNHKFKPPNYNYHNKVQKQGEQSIKMAVEEDKLIQYLNDKENEINEKYKSIYNSNSTKIMNDVVISLFNENIDVKTIYKALNNLFNNITEDFIQEIIEEEIYKHKYDEY